MPTEIDSLQISINAKAQSANNAIDVLVGKLDRLTTSLGRINSSGSNLNTLAVGVSRLGSAMQTMNTVKTADFTRLSKNLTSLNSLDTSKLNTLAVNVNHVATSFKSLSGMSESSKQMVELANGIRQLGYKSVDKAIINIPKLASSMRQLMTELSKAPRVSRNLIDMTNALAKLARTGASSGRAAQSLSKSIGTYSASAGMATKKSFSLAGAIGKVYASYWLLFRAFSGIGRSITLASDLTEVQNVVDTTFGDMSYKIEEFAKTSIEQFGMSELTLKKVASQFQAMGSAMNIDESMVGSANKYLNEQTKGYVGLSNSMADVSLNLTKLTADMSSFYNVEQEAVAEDLQSIFTGQTKPLRQYGVDLTEVNLKQWAMTQGLNSNIEAMTQAEKTMLRYQYVLAHTGAAQGDFAKTADTWANQIRILRQNFEQLSIIIGRGFINVLKPVVKAINGFMQSIISFATTVYNALGKIFGWRFEVSTGGVAGDLGDGEISAGGISDNLGNAVDNAKKLKQQLQGFDELNVLTTNQDTGSDSGSGTGGGAGGGSDIGEWVKGGQTMLEEFKSEIETLRELGEYIRDTLIETMESIDWDSIYEKARGFGKGLADFLNGLLDYDKEGRTLFGSLGKTLAGTLNTVVYSALSFFENFDFYQFGVNLADGLGNFFETFDFKALAEAINKFVDGLIDFVKGFFSDEENIKKITSGLGEFFSNLEIDTIVFMLGKILWGSNKGGISKTSSNLENLISTLFSSPLSLKFGAVAAITVSTAYLGFEGGKELGKMLFPEDAEYYDNFWEYLKPEESLQDKLYFFTKGITESTADTILDFEKKLADSIVKYAEKQRANNPFAQWVDEAKTKLSEMFQATKGELGKGLGSSISMVMQNTGLRDGQEYADGFLKTAKNMLSKENITSFPTYESGIQKGVSLAREIISGFKSEQYNLQNVINSSFDIDTTKTSNPFDKIVSNLFSINKTSEAQNVGEKYGKSTLEGYSNGLNNSALWNGSINQWMNGVDKSIHDSVLDFGSPSKKTEQYGKDTILGYNNGLNRNFSSTYKLLDGFFANINNKFKANMDSLNQMTVNMANNLGEKLGSIEVNLPETKSVVSSKVETSYNTSMSDGYMAYNNVDNMRETNNLMRELITLVEKGSVIELNGREVGKSLQRQNAINYNRIGRNLFEY